MTTRAMRKPRRNFHRDQRGAVAMAGAFMATFMAATLWFVVGIGDAAVHHERMQDGSDAGAYSSAVYQARGMNIISMGNVVMAAEFAVNLSIDVSKILDKIELGILIVKCFTPPWTDCAFIPPDISLNMILQKLLDKLTDMIMDQLNFLDKIQAKISKLIPYLAQARALKSMIEHYATAVNIGDAISLSMLPQGKRLGLPVQEESQKVLCQKAAKVVPLTALKPLIEQALPLYVAAFTFGVTMAAAAGACTSDENSGKNPKKIFVEARNGDKFFQIYGFGVHIKDLFKKGDKAVDIAAWGKAGAAKALAALKGKILNVQRTGFCDTEFYYDHAGKWDSYKDDALWNLRWRVRLRRYRKIPNEIREWAPLDVATEIEKHFDDIIH